MAGAERARLLDITRLADRLDGRPLTGVDRVEAAYLRDFAARTDRPLWLLWRTAPVTRLLPAASAATVLAVVDGLAPPDRLRDRLAAEAVGRAVDLMLARLIRRHLAGGGDYYNTGHTNLRRRGLAALRRAGLRRHVLIHDTIPLDRPEDQPRGQSARFRRKLIAALTGSETLIANSAATAADIDRWAVALHRRPPPVVVAPLGVTLAEAAPLAEGLPPPAPYFVALGTIEPRKNHALLLDAWDHLAAGPGPVPVLLVIGRRGWASPALLARLDALPPQGPVREVSGASDGAVAALLAGAHALLMPSRAEGFGLPLAEAAARGTPIVTTPLPAAQAYLGDRALILPPDDPVAWADAIRRLASAPRAVNAPLRLPGWTDHFDLVLPATEARR